tara:strand:+ start:282 stop:536 length:255 start_codon:yes stop_codon:yes gene_type:complete
MTQGLLPHLTLDDFFESVKALRPFPYESRGNYVHSSQISSLRNIKLKSPKPKPDFFRKLVRKLELIELEHPDIYKVRISKGSGS